MMDRSWFGTMLAGVAGVVVTGVVDMIRDEVQRRAGVWDQEYFDRFLSSLERFWERSVFCG